MFGYWRVLGSVVFLEPSVSSFFPDVCFFVAEPFSDSEREKLEENVWKEAKRPMAARSAVSARLWV